MGSSWLAVGRRWCNNDLQTLCSATVENIGYWKKMRSSVDVMDRRIDAARVALQARGQRWSCRM